MNQSHLPQVVALCAVLVTAAPCAAILAPEAASLPTTSSSNHATDPTNACEQGFADACGQEAGSLATPPGSSFVLGPSVPGRWSLDEIGTGATITYSFAVGDGYRTGELNAEGRIVPLDTFIPFYDFCHLPHGLYKDFLSILSNTFIIYFFTNKYHFKYPT